MYALQFRSSFVTLLLFALAGLVMVAGVRAGNARANRSGGGPDGPEPTATVAR